MLQVSLSLLYCCVQFNHNDVQHFIVPPRIGLSGTPSSLSVLVWCCSLGHNAKCVTSCLDDGYGLKYWSGGGEGDHMLHHMPFSYLISPSGIVWGIALSELNWLRCLFGNLPYNSVVYGSFCLITYYHFDNQNGRLLMSTNILCAFDLVIFDNGAVSLHVSLSSFVMATDRTVVLITVPHRGRHLCAPPKLYY